MKLTVALQAPIRHANSASPPFIHQGYFVLLVPRFLRYHTARPANAACKLWRKNPASLKVTPLSVIVSCPLFQIGYPGNVRSIFDSCKTTHFYAIFILSFQLPLKTYFFRASLYRPPPTLLLGDFMNFIFGRRAGASSHNVPHGKISDDHSDSMLDE